MAVVITVEDVKNGFETTVADDEIELLIEVVDAADACLDGASVPDSKQKILKIYAVRHMLQMQSNGGKGTVTSERAPNGASRSYANWSGKGVEATTFGSLLKQIDSSGCMVAILENSGPKLMIMSIG